MKKHELKCWPEFFQAIREGKKKFDIRKNDRGFEVGDHIVQREWDPNREEYTGREIDMTIEYILSDERFGLKPGFICMSFNSWALFIRPQR